MTFFNASLIFGIAAVAVPVVLHLIARREPKKVVFPSVRFLTKRFESNRSRMRVRRWWLLALRVAALAALALALARPAIHQALSVTWLTIGLVATAGVALLVLATIALARRQSKATIYGLAAAALVAILASLGWGGMTFVSGTAPSRVTSEPVSIAIVIDNAATSAWKTPNDDRIARMKDLATWMVTRLPRTSRIAIIDRSSQVASFSLDVASSISNIERIRPLEVAQPLAARLDAATRLVRTSDLANRQVLLVTDLSVATWNDSLSESGLAALLAEQPVVPITVFDLGEFDGSNRSLSQPTFADSTPPKGVPIALTSNLTVSGENQSEPIAATVELDLFVDDPALPVVRDGKIVRPQLQSVDRTSVRVAPGGSSELLMTIPSLDVGVHHGRIRLVGNDAMPLDDVRYFTLEVLKPSSILLVGDDEDEASIMKMAVIASPGLVDEQNAEFLVERVGYADLPAVRLTDFASIVLLDPPAETLRDTIIEGYVRDGGNVLVTLGPRAGTAEVSDTWTPSLLRPWRAPEPGTFLQVVAANHPVTQALSKDTPWADFRVMQYWQLDPAANDRVLMTFAGTDHPALIERLVRNNAQDAGDQKPGRLLILATPLPARSAATRPWNDLFGIDPWPAWLLTRQSIELLTGRGNSDLTVPVGQPVTVRFPEDNAASLPERIQLFPPGDSSPVPLNVSPDANGVTVTDVSRSGVFWLRGLPSNLGFSANIDQTATNLGRLDPSELDQIFGPDRYVRVTDRESIELAENEASQRVSLHSPAILLVLLVFLLEQILGNRFYGRG